MRRLFSSPALSLGLFLLWIMLTQSLSAGNVLIGVGLALFWPVVTRRLADSEGRPRRPLLMARLLVRVVGDMLKSNAEVAWVLLRRRSSALRSRFVSIPLELKSPAGLSLLAMIVTFTPGTAWVELSLDKQSLLLHVFDAKDDASVVTTIKDRYEQPLKAIFE